MIRQKSTGLAADVREVVAATRVGDCARVIVLTARRTASFHFTVTTVAYDSGHPGECLVQGYYSGQYLPELLQRARSAEADTFDPHPEVAGCDCWALWDPHCGRPGCFGVRPAAALVGAR
jgi:hypothetical protein